MLETPIVSRESVVSLREINAQTVREVCQLSDTLTTQQSRMVAPNVYSLAQAHFTPNTTFRAVYADETLVGFIMWRLRSTSQDGVTVLKGYLWRFMIAQSYQGMGFGRKTIELLIEQLKSQQVTLLFTSCVQGEGSPEGFYQKLDFRRTGDLSGDEVVLIRNL